MVSESITASEGVMEGMTFSIWLKKEFKWTSEEDHRYTKRTWMFLRETQGVTRPVLCFKMWGLKIGSSLTIWPQTGRDVLEPCPRIYEYFLISRVSIFFIFQSDFFIIIK